MNGSPRPGARPSSLRRRMPVAGRPRWAWLLGTRFRRWRLRRTLRPLADRMAPHATVLDAGCGPGFDALVLSRLVADGTVDRWILIDAQPGMIAEARRAVRDGGGRVARSALAVGSAASLALRDDCVDVLLSIGVLCCMDESAVDRAVSETRRVVRPGGWVVLAVPSRRLRVDLERFGRAGFSVVARPRRGAVLLQKTK